MTDEHERIFITGTIFWGNQWLIQVAFKQNAHLLRMQKYWTSRSTQDEALYISLRWQKCKEILHEIRR